MAKHTKRLWSKLRWGVLFSPGPGKEPTLLGDGSVYPYRARYIGEPVFPLLFRTREQVRQWCRRKGAEYQRDYGAEWSWRPVRVRETVTAVKGVKG